MNLEYGEPFHKKTIDQCRAIGCRGGLRSSKNRRLRRLAETPVATAMAPEPERETAHAASMRLDRQFPWLRGAERRTTKQTAQQLACPAPQARHVRLLAAQVAEQSHHRLERGKAASGAKIAAANGCPTGPGCTDPALSQYRVRKS